MSYMFEHYCKSKMHECDYEESVNAYEERKFKYPAIYEDGHNQKYAVANISFPATTESIADYLANGASYVIVHNTQLDREILLLLHEGTYYHEYTKNNSFLVLYTALHGEFKTYAMNLVDFLSIDKESGKYKFTAIDEISQG